MRAARRWWWGAGLVLGVTTVAVGAPMVTSGPFSLPGPGPMSSPLWNGPTPRRVAARVRVKTGQVEVQAQSDATPATPYQPVRAITAGGDLLLEGRWTGLQVALALDGGGNPMGAPADGIYEVRPLDPTPRDRFVGEADVEVPPGAWATAYTTSVPGPRLITVRSAGAPAWVRADASDASIDRRTLLDADDASFVAVGGGGPDAGVTGVSLTSSESMAGRASIAVFDAEPAASPTDAGSVVLDSIGVVTGTNQYDYDFALVDGTVRLRVTFVNHATAPMWVLSRAAGVGGWKTEPVDSGHSATIEGRLLELQWCHSAAGRVTVTASVIP